MKKTIEAFLPTAEAIQLLLYPYAEVVLHDIKQDKIVAIYHPFSKRRVGDDSLLSPEEMTPSQDCIGPYEKINWDGKKLRSISSVIRNEKNNAVGLLCINLDVSKLENFSFIIHEFLNLHMTPQPQSLFKEDWQEKINHYIHKYLQEHHLTLDSLNRKEKKELIEHLRKAGAFNTKNAAYYIAKVLKVSRATIYNYLSMGE
jgi:predicted transcriptional regulator YheO